MNYKFDFLAEQIKLILFEFFCLTIISSMLYIFLLLCLIIIVFKKLFLSNNSVKSKIIFNSFLFFYFQFCQK